jgi:hypothetical protein
LEENAELQKELFGLWKEYRSLSLLHRFGLVAMLA